MSEITEEGSTLRTVKSESTDAFPLQYIDKVLEVFSGPGSSQTWSQHELDFDTHVALAQATNALELLKKLIKQKKKYTPSPLAELAISSAATSDEFLYSWEFDIHDVGDGIGVRSILFRLIDTTCNLESVGVSSEIFNRYLISVQENYHDNPFHNFRHAASVTQFACLLSKSLNLAESLGKYGHFAVIFSAILHDVNHPGNTNLFEINSSSERALLYNDVSVLESHHCATTFRLMRQEGLNIMEGFSKETAIDVRKMIVSCILATDMSVHFQLVDEFSRKTSASNWSTTGFPEKTLLGKIVVHAADLSNPVRPFEIAKKWSLLIAEEFNKQVELERELGHPLLVSQLVTDFSC